MFIIYFVVQKKAHIIMKNHYILSTIFEGFKVAMLFIGHLLKMLLIYKTNKVLYGSYKCVQFSISDQIRQIKLFK